VSIIAYTGLPGSGKSYDVVANQIVAALKRNRRVVTNVPLLRDAVRNATPKGEIVEFPMDLIAAEPERLEEYCTPGSVCIIDELWRLFPSGVKTNQVPEIFKSWLAEHRHRVDSRGQAMQIVFVTQDLSQIAAFARQLVEQTFHHTKLSHVGMEGRFRIDIYHGPVTGAVPSTSNRLREVHARYKPEIFLMYKSHTMSESMSSGADESKMDLRGNVLRRPIIWLGLLGVIGAVAWAVPTLAGLLGGGNERPPIAQRVALPDGGLAEVSGSDRSVREPRMGPPARTAQPAQRERKPYKLVGHIIVEGGAQVGLIDPGDGSGPVIQVPYSNCWNPGDGLERCRFDGVVVTPWGILE
jgi:zona occludens toxin